MHALAILLAIVAPTFAYQVTGPSGSKGWTNVGPQPVTWQRVDTDPTNFTIVLTDTNRAELSEDQVLVAQQDGVATNTVNCNPPSAGWPLGKTFRINLVKSTEDQSTIYAQSSEFQIAVPNATVSGSLTTPLATTPIAVPTTPLATTPSSTTATGGSNAPPDPNSAAAIKASTGLMAILGAAAFFAA
ncbi:hypothetical protein NP233_g593 [Leucocoprinus birnbaumii]|uniref:Yeast cell wall synthesis Kre9/Knh1-like N-terminal domain-containing protein n=1 Tax=Leucocoprinus birnbaumii TaxID=56174 RepID=A0AAD5YYJ3_9AGAR|nr:hypothetical protein NP233_g593 [Leucocoprinus birnbaumii]